MYLLSEWFGCQVAQLSKFSETGGLGISLEGTVDVEDGVEVRPHHYIRSVLADGPVGVNGRLTSADELLEVRTCTTAAAAVNAHDVMAVVMHAAYMSVRVVF